MDVKQLEARATELKLGFKRLAEDQDLDELLRLIPRPGWTTPAEFLFAMGLAESMVVQVKVLMSLKKTLIEGSRAVVAK